MPQAPSAPMRFAVLAVFVLLATSLIADASRTAPQSPPANAQVCGLGQLPSPPTLTNAASLMAHCSIHLAQLPVWGTRP